MRAKRLLLLSLILSVACKAPTPEEQLDSILSWIGTAEMAGDAWLRHTTPDTYTRQTLELSAKTLGETSNDLLVSLPPSADAAAFDTILGTSGRRIARMAALIRAKNAPDFARQLDSLRDDHEKVEALAHSIGSKE